MLNESEIEQLKRQLSNIRKNMILWIPKKRQEKIAYTENDMLIRSALMILNDKKTADGKK